VGGSHALRFGGAYDGSTTLNNNPVRRQLAENYSDDLYVRYLFRAEQGFDSNDFVVLWLDNTAGITDGDLDDDLHDTTSAFIGARGSDRFFVRINNQGQQDFYPVGGLDEGEDFLVVGRLFKASGSDSYNRLSLWINPDHGDYGSPDVTASVGSNTGFNFISHVGIRTGQYTEIGDSYLIDGLVLGTTWDQVVPVPEPTTLSLLGLGGLAALIRRRRTRA
jgi:hypothetical protein